MATKPKNNLNNDVTFTSVSYMRIASVATFGFDDVERSKHVAAKIFRYNEMFKRDFHTDQYWMIDEQDNKTWEPAPQITDYRYSHVEKAKLKDVGTHVVLHGEFEEGDVGYAVMYLLAEELENFIRKIQTPPIYLADYFAKVLLLGKGYAIPKKDLRNLSFHGYHQDRYTVIRA